MLSTSKALIYGNLLCYCLCTEGVFIFFLNLLLRLSEECCLPSNRTRVVLAICALIFMRVELIPLLFGKGVLLASVAPLHRLLRNYKILAAYQMYYDSFRYFDWSHQTLYDARRGHACCSGIYFFACSRTFS